MATGNNKMPMGLLIGLLVLLHGSCREDASATALVPNEKEIQLRDQVEKLMGIRDEHPEAPAFEYTEVKRTTDHDQYRLVFDSHGEKVPGYLLIPKNIRPPYPVMICLQGHSPGMYISMGIYNNDKEKKLVDGGRDLAIQAVSRGWAAFVLEQKGFGERQKGTMSCNHQSLQEILRGKNMIGQRVADIRKAVDIIYAQDSLDNGKIGIIGNSSGGTTGYYAAAMDQRIDLAVVSCSFSTFERSWLKYPHCACGYLPGLMEIADMPDLAQLIAPRDLIIVAGKEDYLADLEGVYDGFETAKTFYQKHHAQEKLQLIVGNGGHQFYPERTWPVIQKVKNNW